MTQKANAEILPLGDLGDIASGSTPKTGVKEYWNGDIPWITPADLTGHEGVWFRGKLKRISKSGFDACSTRMLPRGSILFSSRAPIGHCAVAAYPLCTNQGFKSLVPNERLDPVYGYFALRAVTPSIVARGRGATFAEVSKEIMESVRIPVRPLTEQKRIAALLEKADRLRRTRRYARQLSDTFLQSVFLEMFGALFQRGESKTRIGDLVKITGGGTPSRDIAAYFTGTIPWLTSKDMRGDYIFDTQEHITEDAVAKSATHVVPAGSILVVVKSKVLMHRLPVAISVVPLCHGQDIKSIQCSNELLSEFARYALRYYELHLLNLARGANTEGLTLPMLNELLIPDVSLPLQQKFADIVRRFERLRAQQREAERQAEHLFQTLLHRAFSEGGL